ncbi:HipA domain-containing protein [Chitinophaga caeni]|nr:HipA domain-containing protein [Chitinophaga caeni]
MAELAANAVQRSITIPGVQPKLSLTLVKNTLDDKDKGRLTIVGALGGNYILKPPHADYSQLPENEHATMKMAQNLNIPVVPSSLIRLASGELAYITKRIDRTVDGNKIHMLDMFQILEAFDKYKGSMEKVGKAIAKYVDNTLLDLTTFFEITLFCFITGNNDMHLKNFSLIVNDQSKWRLSPAYDLLNVSIVNPNDKEELALTLGARKNKFNRSRFVEFGESLGLNNKQIEHTFAQLIRNEEMMIGLINSSFLSVSNRQNYILLIKERMERIRS